MFSISLVSILFSAFKGEFKQSIKISVEMYMAAVWTLIWTKIKVSSSFSQWRILRNFGSWHSPVNDKHSYYAFGRSQPKGEGWFGGCHQLMCGMWPSAGWSSYSVIYFFSSCRMNQKAFQDQMYASGQVLIDSVMFWAIGWIKRLYKGLGLLMYWTVDWVHGLDYLIQSMVVDWLARV